jgi:hypothetical protein
MSMKLLISTICLVLAAVAVIAFGFLTIRRESEVSMHIFTDEGFARFRMISAVVGVAASLLECWFVWKLYGLLRGKRETQGA